MDIKPGRELDALVAEKVVKSFVPAGTHPRLRDDAWIDRGDFVWEPPPYSTSIEAAWQVHQVTRSWLFNKRVRYLHALQELVQRQHVDAIAWPDVLIFLEPYHFCLAALKAVEKP